VNELQQNPQQEVLAVQNAINGQNTSVSNPGPVANSNNGYLPTRSVTPPPSDPEPNSPPVSSSRPSSLATRLKPPSPRRRNVPDVITVSATPSNLTKVTEEMK
jgi:hypothetical protein